MSAEKCENSWCRCWMIGGVFPAGILVRSSLILWWSTSYVPFPRTSGRFEKKESGFGWHGGGKAGSQQTGCYYEVPKTQYETVDIVRKVVTMVAFENKGTQNWHFLLK